MNGIFEFVQFVSTQIKAEDFKFKYLFQFMTRVYIRCRYECGNSKLKILSIHLSMYVLSSMSTYRLSVYTSIDVRTCVRLNKGETF